MTALRSFISVEPLPNVNGMAQLREMEHGKAALYQEMFNHVLPHDALAAFRVSMVDTLWPWAMRPVQGIKEGRTMLASEEVVATGYPGLWSVGEVEPYEPHPSYSMYVGRTIFYGRLLIFGMDGAGRPRFMHTDEAQRTIRIVGANQETWGVVYGSTLIPPIH